MNTQSVAQPGSRSLMPVLTIGLCTPSMGMN